MWRYYVDFWLFPLIAAVIVAVDCRSLAWLGWAALGALLFTFVEYWTHRVLLHRLLWNGKHERHHTHPWEPTIFPVWYTPAIFAGFLLLMPLPVFAGFVAGYCWFLAWHHALHHWQLDRRPWVRAYANWHNQHHRGLPVNYGITTPLWDLVFGTYRAAR
jgi:sterol desaturase/sphingolipid hydroxylase (fatty acid hydroxylase superfamily)